MTTQVIVRIDPKLKEQINKLAKAEGKNISELVRELLENYVKERDIGKYIDDLWERIGTKMKKRGITPSDVDKAIRQVRTQK